MNSDGSISEAGNVESISRYAISGRFSIWNNAKTISTSYTFVVNEQNKEIMAENYFFGYTNGRFSSRLLRFYKLYDANITVDHCGKSSLLGISIESKTFNHS